MIRHGFRAMGTQIELLVDASCADGAVEAAEHEFHRLEGLLSRFRPDSELSRLNAEGEIDAGPDLLRVVDLALDGRARSGGRFDPTVHDDLIAAGYDRSFELVEPESADAAPTGSSRARTSAGDVTVDGSRIRLVGGARLDLGGIGKGYAAERAAEILATAGPCLVNAGGDIATRGGAWTVEIAVASGSLVLELAGSSGLATSGRDQRRWRRGGHELHHLIDPATGLPAESDLIRVTAVASDAVEAEFLAKALFLAGSERAAAEADVADIPAVLVRDDGRTLYTGGLR